MELYILMRKQTITNTKSSVNRVQCYKTTKILGKKASVGGVYSYR